MAGYIGSKASVVSSGAERKKVFAITTTTTSLTGLAYTPNLVHVFHNGIRLVDGTDYTATNGTTITLTNAAQNGDEVVVVSYATFQTSDTVSASAGGTFSNDVAINGDLTVDSNTLYVDATNNRVGVGTSSPDEALSVEGGNMKFTNTVSNESFIYFTHSSTANRRAYIGALETDGNGNSLVFAPNANGFDAAEAMRIDSSGNLLVGKTALSSSTDGFQFTVGSAAWAAMTNSSASSTDELLLLNRTGSDGELIQFKRGGTTVGTIGAFATDIAIMAGSKYGLKLYDGNDGIVHPIDPSGGNYDNLLDLGYSASRFDDIYATNGTIQTSDRNEKQDIAELDEAEKRVAVAAKGLIRKYRWKDAVAEKGDEARIHVGIIAQDLQDAFAAEGLDAGRYAMFISSTWWEHDGQTYETAEEAPEGATERTRFGVRYPELLAFIIGAM